MIDSSDLRVFSVLVRPSFSILAANAAVIVWSGYLALTAPEDQRGPYVVLLLLQSFAASAGYAVRARRGHFDQLLAGRLARRPFAIAHAAVSVAVGITAWLIVCLLDALGGDPHWPLGLTPSALAAICYVSGVSWAFSVPFSRYTAGVAWLVLAIVIAGSGHLIDLRTAYVAASGTWDGVRHALPAALFFPPFLIGEPSAPPAVVTGVVLAASCLAVMWGIVFIVRTDVPLEDAQ